MIICRKLSKNQDLLCLFIVNTKCKGLHNMKNMDFFFFVLVLFKFVIHIFNCSQVLGRFYKTWNFGKNICHSLTITYSLWMCRDLPDIFIMSAKEDIVWEHMSWWVKGPEEAKKWGTLWFAFLLFLVLTHWSGFEFNARCSVFASRAAPPPSGATKYYILTLRRPNWLKKKKKKQTFSFMWWRLEMQNKFKHYKCKSWCTVKLGNDKSTRIKWAI